MAFEFYLFCLVASAAILRLVWFVSYAFTGFWAQWDPQFLWVSPALALALQWALGRAVKDHMGRLWLAGLLLRAGLSWMMFVYGLGKVLNQQFSPPSLLAQDARVYETLGWWKAWSFFGHSKIYECFLGWGEVVGAVLLLFHRTVPVGSILLAVMLMNIVVVNFTHDIGVRVSSSLYLLEALLLIWLDRARVWAYLRGAAVEAQVFPEVMTVRRRQISALRAIFVVLLTGYLLWCQFKIRDYLMQPVAPLKGVWVALDYAPVERLRFEDHGHGSLSLRRDDAVKIDYQFDSDRQTLTWKTINNAYWAYNYEGTARRIGQDRLELSTSPAGKPLVYRRVLPAPQQGAVRE